MSSYMRHVSKKSLSGLMVTADIGMQILTNVPVFYFGTLANKYFDYILAGTASAQQLSGLAGRDDRESSVRLCGTAGQFAGVCGCTDTDSR